MTALAIVTAAVRADFSRAPTRAETPAIGSVARLHGVQGLVHRRLQRSTATEGWTTSVRDELSAAYRQQLALELLRARELRRVVEALGDAGVELLVLKGAALAYCLYEEPSLRERGDTDLLVREVDRTRAHRTLISLGYRPWSAMGSRVASYQQTYISDHHNIDLHWRLSNAQLFASTLSYEEMASGSTPVPRLGAHARRPGDVHAMLHALMHRATHIRAPYYVRGDRYREPNRLIWLYDIHLLANRFDASHWDEFVALAKRAQVAAVCLDGLAVTRARLGTVLPAHVVAHLDAVGSTEPSAAYLSAGGLRHALIELRAVSSWSGRLQLLGDVFLPHPEHMFSKYGTNRRSLLPWLYVRRAVEGLVKAARPED